MKTKEEPELDSSIESILAEFGRRCSPVATLKGVDNPMVTPANINEATDHLKALIREQVLEGQEKVLEEMSFAVVEPCEPDCDAVRHALHEGSWEAHLKIDQKIKALRERKND